LIVVGGKKLIRGHSLCGIGGHLVRASESSQAASSGDDTAAAVASTIATTATTFKHLMLPIMDRNPYLSAATRQVQTM
jgi:hypothetical protein